MRSHKGASQNEEFINKYNMRLKEALAKYPATASHQIYIDEIAREIEKSRERLD